MEAAGGASVQAESGRSVAQGRDAAAHAHKLPLLVLGQRFFMSALLSKSHEAPRLGLSASGRFVKAQCSGPQLQRNIGPVPVLGRHSPLGPC